MIQVAICDDEEQVRVQLYNKVKQLYPKWEVVAYGDGRELLEAMKKIEFMIFFLDIELGSVNGYDISKQIRQQSVNSVIIFISNYDEYACDAFEVDALRFLKKPYEEKKLIEAIHKAAEVVEAQCEKFTFVSNAKEYTVKMSKICYIERRQRVLYIHLANGDCYETYRSLRELEKGFPEKFFVRTHQGFMINLSYVQSVQESVVILEQGEHIPLSRSRKEIVRNRYMDYCWCREERYGECE